jgi:pyridoxine 4-dehydrogenase
VRNRSRGDVLAACERLGIAFLPWFPLGGKSCTRALKAKRVAARRGIAPAQVALVWLLARSPVMLPIPGTQSIAHLEENMRAPALKFAPDDLGDLG